MKQLQRVYVPQFLAPSVNEMLVCLCESQVNKCLEMCLYRNYLSTSRFIRVYILGAEQKEE